MRGVLCGLLFALGILTLGAEEFAFLSSEEKARILAEYGQPGDTLAGAWNRYLCARVTQQRHTGKPVGVHYAPAEYGKAEGVCFSWQRYNSLLKPLIREVAQDDMAYVVVSENTERVRRELQKYGCKMSHVEIIKAPLDSVWIRDYGPWFIYTRDGDREVVDLIYNRPRPLDDKFPSFFAKHYHWKSHRGNLVLAGGNLILDGYGVAIMTDVVFDPEQGGNPELTSKQLRQHLKDYFNCHTVYVLEDMEKDGTGHIDMFCKLLDRRTLVVGKYEKPSHGAGDNYHILDSNADRLARCQNGLGEDFAVHRIAMPPYDGATYTYTNSLIVNAKVLVPTYGCRQDEEALDLYRRLMPGHKIIGYDCSGIIGANGAIHCITDLVMSDPLEILHRAPNELSGTKVQIRAEIRAIHRLKPDGVIVRHYLPDGTKFSTTMESFDRSHFSCEIFVPADIDRIQYFIRAEDETGMYETSPETAEIPCLYTVVRQ